MGTDDGGFGGGGGGFAAVSLSTLLPQADNRRARMMGDIRSITTHVRQDLQDVTGFTG